MGVQSGKLLLWAKVRPSKLKKEEGMSKLERTGEEKTEVGQKKREAAKRKRGRAREREGQVRGEQ